MNGASTRASPWRATGNKGGDPSAWSPAQWVIGGRGPLGVVTGPVGDWWADHLRNVISTCGGRTCRIPGCDGPPTNHPLGLRSSLRTPLSVHGPLAKPGQRVWDPRLRRSAHQSPAGPPVFSPHPALGAWTTCETGSAGMGSPAATVRPPITHWASGLLSAPRSRCMDHLRNRVSGYGIPGCDGPPTNHPVGIRSSSHSVIGGLGMPCRGGCPLPS